MKKIILFNGPPNSGKDHCAEIVESLYKADHLRFKDKLYEITACLNSLQYDQFKSYATDRNTKEQKMYNLRGLQYSPRELLIETSEEVIKPYYGKDYFGKDIAKKIRESNNEYFVISDCGFKEEIQTVIDDLPNCQFFLVRIHRRGYTFKGDSRSYVNIDEILNFDLYNNSSVQILERIVTIISNKFFNADVKPTLTVTADDFSLKMVSGSWALRANSEDVLTRVLKIYGSSDSFKKSNDFKEIMFQLKIDKSYGKLC